jgi:hypothetical protein
LDVAPLERERQDGLSNMKRIAFVIIAIRFQLLVP